ncbi:MAG: LCP family protein [Anaerolineales bacterium]|jgi:LCP family protein required for cell wall assembly
MKEKRRTKRRFSFIKTTPEGRSPDWVSIGIAIGFLLAALATAFFAFSFVRDIIRSTDIFQLGGVSLVEGGDPSNPDAGDGSGGDSSSGQISVEDIDEVDFTSRINVLVLGLDYRDWEQDGGPARSDTMVLATIDPVGKTASLLSIPRDLWVNVPGFGQNKINAAYFLGESNRLPGGGPELAAKTVEEFLGIEVHYWAQVDFTAFVQFVDYIGGVKLTVDQPIKLEFIGTSDEKYLQPGRQTLDGAYALAYARNRSEGDGDFSRAQRTQQVILAIRNQFVRKDVQRLMFSNPKGIWDIFSQNIQTNIPFLDAFSLGKIALQINPEQISQHIIAPPDYVTHAFSPDGLTILKPITQNIRIMRDQIFTPIGITGPGAVGADPEVLMQSEAARVGVYNGSNVSGLAGATEQFLNTLQVQVTDVGNSDAVPSTTIYDYTGNPYTVQYLVDLMGIQKTRIFNSYDPNSAVDVAVVVGNEWQVPQQ